MDWTGSEVIWRITISDQEIWVNFDSKTSNDYQFKELSSLTGVKPYVLRFWESEFEQISPSLGEDGTKTYSENDRKSENHIFVEFVLNLC